MFPFIEGKLHIDSC